MCCSCNRDENGRVEKERRSSQSDETRLRLMAGKKQGTERASECACERSCWQTG